MKQKEFFTILQKSQSMQRKLQVALLNGGDELFYFTLGNIFANLGIYGWDSDAFIEKVCKICEIEF